MKKLWSSLLALTMGLSVVSFAACYSEEKTEDHHFSSSWISDEIGHWHACTDNDCSEKSDFVEHTFDGAICNVCNYEKEHVWSETWSFNAYNHWHACTNNGCREITDVTAHTIKNNKCTNNCGYKKDVIISTDTPTEGLRYTLNVDEASYAVTGIGSAEGVRDIVIAAEYNGLPVTAVGNYAFTRSNIESVYLPDSIMRIEFRAFYDCDWLESINLHNNITYISDQAFEYCYFSELLIPASVTSIGFRTFRANTALTSVKFEEGSQCTFIGGEAFYGCYMLESIEIPAAVTVIGECAFSGCSMLERIEYKGTVAEFESIDKREGWLDESKRYTIICTDGTVTWFD